MKKGKYSGDMFTSKANKGEESLDPLPSEETNQTKAIHYRDEARKAVKEGRYNDAWQFYNKQKDYYIKHAQDMSFTKVQIQALDATVSEELANQLRLEGKDLDALFHIMYWIIGTRHRRLKRHSQKLKAYFNRCKFEYINLEEVESYIDKLGEGQLLNTEALYKQVKTWDEYNRKRKQESSENN